MIPDHSRQILEALPDAVLIVTSRGKVLAANRHVQDFGFDQRSLVGGTLGEWVTAKEGSLEDLLSEFSRTRSPVPGVLILKSPDKPICRCYGSVFFPASDDQPAEIMLRLVPKSAALQQFRALNEKIDQLGHEIVRRRKSEEDLRRERKQLEITLSSIGDAVIVTDATGNVTMMNGVAQTLTGWDMGAAAGRPLAEVFRIINEYTRRPVENPVEKVFATGSIVGLANHTILISRDGTEWPIDDSAAPIKDADGSCLGVVLIFRDISEQREWLHQLTDSEERFRQLAEGVDDVFYVTDPHRPAVLYVSPAYERIWGRSCSSLMTEPRSFAEAIHRDDFPRAQEAWQQQLDGRSTVQEYRILTPDGKLKWIRDRSFPIRDNDGAVSRIAGIAEDFTERRQTEVDLRFMSEASRTLAGLVDYESTLQIVAQLAVPDFADWCGVDVVDSEGKLQQLAVAHVDPDKAALAIHMRKEFPPDPEAPVGAAHVLRTGKSEMMAEIPESLLESAARSPEHFRLLQELGLKSYMSVPLIIRGEIFGVMTFVSAESNRHYTEGNLRLAEDLAHRAAIAIDNARLYSDVKQAARRKDEFLAMLAHELRNPLAPIRSGLDVLRLGYDRPEVLELMDRQVDHLVRLVEDLLDVSRILRGKVELRRESVQLADLIHDAIETVRPQIAAQEQQIECRLPDRDVWIDGDPVRLSQVFYNLLNNASKYSEPGGRIWLETELKEESVSVRCRDEGIGIESEFLPDLFELFTQADRSIDRSQGGLGIGLTVVKNLVELHGGQITAKSKGPNLGSEFTVSLPLSLPDQTEGKVPDTHHAGEPRRILIVDDNVGAAKMLSILLTAIGSHEIEMVHDGAAALEVVDSFNPAIIFLDIGLPKMNGYEVARRLRSTPEPTPFSLIALTGYGAPEDRDKSHAAGFDEHLVKPPSIEDLKRVIQRERPKLKESGRAEETA